MKNVGSEDVDYIGNSYDFARSTDMEYTQRFYFDKNCYETRLNWNHKEIFREYVELSPFKGVN